MMKLSVAVAFIFMHTSLFSQGEINIIEQKIDRIISDREQLHKQLIVEITSAKEIDSIDYYYHNNSLRLITFYRFTSALSYGEGVPYADYHFKKLFYFESDTLKYIAETTITEFYDNYKKGSHSELEESKFAIDNNGNKICFNTRKTEGKTTGLKTKLEDIPIIKMNQKYCSFYGVGKKALELKQKLLIRK